MVRLFVVAGLVASGSAGAQAPALSTAEIGRCFEAQSARVPFAGVAIVTRGDESFERAVGSLDAEGRVPMRADARFRTASVGKVLTRVAIGRLVQSGRVSLDAPVRSLLPELPESYGAVTVDMLLRHRSGVPSLTRIGPDIGRRLSSAQTARELVPLVASSPLEFEPGTREAYSNGGFLLLGAVIEAASGSSYEAFLESEIFGPLGMRSTGLTADAETAVPLTRMPPMPGPPLETARPVGGGAGMRGTAAGDAVSTAADLVRLGRALIGDELLSPEVKQRVFPRRADPWSIAQNGGSFGVNADFAVFPESGWIVAVLTNRDPPAGEIMGETLRTLAAGGGCRVLGEEDRPSPFPTRPPAPPRPRQ